MLFGAEMFPENLPPTNCRYFSCVVYKRLKIKHCKINNYIQFVGSFNGIALGIFPFATTYSITTFAGSFSHLFHLVLIAKSDNFRVTFNTFGAKFFKNKKALVTSKTRAFAS
jgi:hypothetical protein